PFFAPKKIILDKVGAKMFPSPDEEGKGIPDGQQKTAAYVQRIRLLVLLLRRGLPIDRKPLSETT
ncbi:MAG: hypothetical protein RBT20_10280, partial [Syntrophales bacterium]|nr:hypothetical protein [Syntrophales bacterium]